jgi:hypothetical protein
MRGFWCKTFEREEMSVMSKRVVLAAAAILGLLVGSVSIAFASNEQVALSFRVKGKVSKKEFRPARLTYGLGVSTADLTIDPLKEAKLKFPARRTLRFVPRKKRLPVCRASKTALSTSPAQAEARCAKSRVGNGSATFQLGQFNSPAAFRVGSVLIYYGGKVGRTRDVRLRFSAWSNDTGAGVYAEGILRRDGSMNIKLPVLTADSSVTSLNLAIPGAKRTITWASGGSTVLAPGRDRRFVRVKCKRGRKLAFKGTFLLGDRSSTGQPTGPTTTVSSSTSARCGR